MVTMADTEKITINLSVVDLGQMDLLVEQGFYSSRTDLIRTAIRRQLDLHGTEIKATVARKRLVVGVLSYSRSELERRREAGEVLDILVLGMLILQSDVTPELAQATIRSVELHGVLRAAEPVKAALSDRME
jgi:Arc/MetJ-type ribon-helix-helix transcriptional regulator